MTNGEKLYNLLQKKQERLTQLCDCSQNQLQYVSEGNMNALLELLGAKQKLIIELEGIDQQIRVYRFDDPEERQWPSPQMRQKCREIVTACQQLVQETLENDQAAEKELVAKKDAAQIQLKQFDSKANVQRAYYRQQSLPESQSQRPSDWGTG